jgi:hypothetical protein
MVSIWDKVQESPWSDHHTLYVCIDMSHRLPEIYTIKAKKYHDDKNDG